MNPSRYLISLVAAACISLAVAFRTLGTVMCREVVEAFPTAERSPAERPPKISAVAYIDRDNTRSFSARRFARRQVRRGPWGDHGLAASA